MNKKLLKILGSALLLVFALIGFTVNSQQDRTKLEIDYLDVGQGDAILIKTPYQQNILIDGGPDASVLAALGENMAFFDKNIDLMILTHPHADHVDGLVDVLKRYQVKKIAFTGVLHTAPDYLAFLEEIKNQNIPTLLINQKMDLDLGADLKLQFLYPLTDLSGKKSDNLNDTSIVNRLIYKDKKFLFMGDLGQEGEADLLKYNFDLTSDIIKIGHHGSKYSTLPALLDQVKSQIAIIPVGKDNDFGHPHAATLDLLKDKNIVIKRTDELGDIKLISDGQNIEFKN